MGLQHHYVLVSHKFSHKSTLAANILTRTFEVDSTIAKAREETGCQQPAAAAAAGIQTTAGKMIAPPTPRVICLQDNWSPLRHVSPCSCTHSPLRMMCMCIGPCACLHLWVCVCALACLCEFESSRGLGGGSGGSTCLVRVTVHSSNSIKQHPCEEPSCGAPWK